MIKGADSHICESATSKIHEVYRCKSRIAESDTSPVSLDIKDMLRYILWVQTQDLLYSTNERPKIRHPFAAAILEQQGILHFPMNTPRKTDSTDTLLGTSVRPDFDWYMLEDDEEDDILLSDEAYCEELEERYKSSTLLESIVNNDDSQFKTTQMVTGLMLDSDGILSSSPCLLAEVDMDPITDSCFGGELDGRMRVVVDPEAEIDPAMEMLHSSSPIILPLLVNEGSACDVDTDGRMELYTLPSLEGSDIEMILL